MEHKQLNADLDRLLELCAADYPDSADWKDKRGQILGLAQSVLDAKGNGRLFKELRVRQLLWTIGWVTPLNTLGMVYDYLSNLWDEYPNISDLFAVARGEWNNSSYSTGYMDDPHVERRPEGLT